METCPGLEEDLNRGGVDWRKAELEVIVKELARTGCQYLLLNCRLAFQQRLGLAMSPLEAIELG